MSPFSATREILELRSAVSGEAMGANSKLTRTQMFPFSLIV